MCNKCAIQMEIDNYPYIHTYTFIYIYYSRLSCFKYIRHPLYQDDDLYLLNVINTYTSQDGL